MSGGPHHRLSFAGLVCRIASTNLMLDYTLGGAAVARSFTSYAGALLAGDADLLRIATGSELFKIDAPALVATMAICVVLGLGTHGSSAFNGAVTAMSLAVIAFVFVAGLLHFDGSKLRPFAPLGARGVLAGASKARRDRWPALCWLIRMPHACSCQCSVQA